MNETTTVNDIEAVIDRVRSVYRRWGRDTTVAQMRADWDALFGGVPVDATVEAAELGGVPGEWVNAPGAETERVMLYFHGGGFQVGSPYSHRELMAGLSKASGCRVFGAAYRLAPEHRYPAALDDACAAYEGLLAAGHAPQHIVLAGDSAGGNLVLTALLKLRDAGRPLPAAAVLMSAWTDMSASGASYETHAGRDPIHQRPMILAMARNYLGRDADARQPLVSPLFAELHGLPPLLVQVGERETVLSDSTEFAAKAQAAGVPVTLQVGEGMIHVYQQFPELAQAQAARSAIGAFLRAHVQPLTK